MKILLLFSFLLVLAGTVANAQDDSDEMIIPQDEEAIISEPQSSSPPLIIDEEEEPIISEPEATDIQEYDG